MTQVYETPGVYIEEVTGPGVIAGVGTSTAAFIGPARRGPIMVARRISSYDDFLRDYALELEDGTFWPYVESDWSFMAQAIEGFFKNGGRQAYVVRVGSGAAAIWSIKNQGNDEVFRLNAKEEGVGGNAGKVEVVSINAAAGVTIVSGSATVVGPPVDDMTVSLGDVTPFAVGDMVIKSGGAVRATVTRINKSQKTVSLNKKVAALAITAGDTLRIADLTPGQDTFRVSDVSHLWPGSVIVIEGEDASNHGTTIREYAVVEGILRDIKQIRLASSPERKETYRLDSANAPTITSHEFQLNITDPAGDVVSYPELSLNPRHPGYVLSPNAVRSSWIEVLPPEKPSTETRYPQQLVKTRAGGPTTNGKNDGPVSKLTATSYEDGLNVLKQVDDVNLICIPDAAANAECQAIQSAMIDHCLALKDRFAILDSVEGAGLSGPRSVESQRELVTSTGGFAALYYPWLEVRRPIPAGQPRPIPPARMLIPPSGHIAGIYARTDAERGVHKAPANTDVRGVLGVERRVSDAQQGPLNVKGVNVLRIFPGSGQVTVWGARTTVDPIITDWVYVNVRRLLLYIEESIEESIRWAVFEPNNKQLWKKLERTITEFLTRVWRDGALFGDRAQDAFYVRVDEALNPPSTQALGRLYIEIGVRPAYPAEFIIARIGLWQGGSESIES